MSRNRVLGDTASTNVLPAPAASTYHEGIQDDALYVNPAAAAGVPYCTVFMNAGAQDGDEITICDPFGQLAAGTTLVVNGNGNFIADGGAAAATQTYASAGILRRFMFSNKVLSGGTINSGTWIVLDR